MKRILIMNIGTELGGIEKSLIDFLRFLSKEDCEIDLALWKKRGPLFSEIPDNINIIENLGPGEFRDIKNYTGIEKTTKYIYYFKFKIFSLLGRAWKSVPPLKKKYDVAVSYCQNGYSPYYIIDKVDAKEKYLWYHHGFYNKSEKEKKQDEKYYNKYSSVITVSNANKEMLLKEFPNLQIKVIHNLINKEKIEKLAEFPISEFDNFEGLKLTTVGRVSEEKGQLLAIEIANLLKQKSVNFKWIFVGDGPERYKCLEKVKEYGLENYCLFIGSKENPYPYIKQADMYIQTSSVEADPLTIHEAVVLKKIIIASDIPAIKEALNYGELGCLCSLKADDFANQIINININRKLYNAYLSKLKNYESTNIKVIKEIKKLL